MKSQTGLSEHGTFRKQCVYKYIACDVWIFKKQAPWAWSPFRNWRNKTKIIPLLVFSSILKQSSWCYILVHFKRVVFHLRVSDQPGINGNWRGRGAISPSSFPCRQNSHEVELFSDLIFVKSKLINCRDASYHICLKGHNWQGSNIMSTMGFYERLLKVFPCKMPFNVNTLWSLIIICVGFLMAEVYWQKWLEFLREMEMLGHASLPRNVLGTGILHINWAQ